MDRHDNTSQVQNDSILSFSDLANAIIEYKWLILSLMAICALIAAIYGHTRTQFYRTDTTLEYLSGKTNNLDSSLAAVSMFESGIASETEINTQIGIIRSRGIMLELIDKYQLNVNIQPKVFPIIGQYFTNNYNAKNTNTPAESKFWLSEYSWGGDSISIGKIRVPEKLENQPLTLQYIGNQKYKLFDENNNMLLTGKVGKLVTKNLGQNAPIEIMVAGINARKNVKFSLTVYPAYKYLNQLSSKISISTDAKRTNLITISYNTPDPHLGKKIINELATLAIAKNSSINAQKSAQTLTFLKEQIPNIGEELKAAQTELANYQKETKSIQIDVQSKALINKISTLSATIANAENQITQLSREYKPESYRLKQAQSILNNLYDQKNKLELQLQSAPSIDQKIINLTRDVEVLQSTYKNLINQIQLYEMLKAGTVSNLVQIDKAVDYPFRVGLSTTRITFLGVIIGLIFGLISTLILYFSRNNIKEGEELESITGIPILANVYEATDVSNKNDTSRHSRFKMLSDIDNYCMSLEAIRGLVTTLKLNLLDSKKTIAISGPCPNVGKTFIVANLAETFAASGKRAMLIDCDLRRGNINQFFDNKKKAGWAELMQGSASLEEVIHSTRYNNLDYIASGKRNAINHLAYMYDQNIEQNINELKKTYDIILIDTPPILATSDANIIFQTADINLLVFAENTHSNKEVSLTMNQIKHANNTADGIIMNRIKCHQGKYYGYKYKYRYQYTYKPEKESIT